MTRISFDLRGAAEASSLSVRALQYAIDEGSLTAHYYNSKPLIHHEDLDAYVKALPTSKRVA